MTGADQHPRDRRRDAERPGARRSTRAATLVARARDPVSSRTSRPQPGWAEQDPEVYWRAIGEACAAGARRPGGPTATAIAGVTLTTQRGDRSS